MTPKPANRERGVAMLLCLFALMILTSIGLGLMYMSNMETGINSNFRSSLDAYYASKAGLEEARDRLRFGFLNYSIALPTGLPTTANPKGVIYLLNPTGGSDPVKPWDTTNAYFDDELCQEGFQGLGLGVQPGLGIKCTASPGAGGWYTTVNSLDPNTNTASALAYKWVRVTMKQNNTPNPFCVAGGGCGAVTQVCANSSNPNNIYETQLPVGATTCEQAGLQTVYIITALAVNATGARRMTQYEVAQVTVPPLPSALTLDGPIAAGAPSLNFPNSNGNSYSGIDHGSSAECSNPLGVNRPGVGTISAGSTANIIAPGVIPVPANYTGSSGSTPDVQPLSNNYLGPYSTIANLNTLVANITSVADQVLGSNPSPVNLGTDANPIITVVNGDLDMGSASGSGILLVTGTLSANGNPTFHGVVMVIGKGVVDFKGTGNGTWYGSLLIANTATDALGNSPGLPANPPGPPTFSWKGVPGSTSILQYDSCFTQGFASHAVLRVLASREQMY